MKPYALIALQYCLFISITVMSGTGCSIERWRAYHECKAQQAQLKAETLRAESEALRSERLQEQEALRSQYAETLKTQLGLPVGQKLVLGQIQVDEDKLMEMLTERKKQQQALKEFYDDYEKKRQEKLQESLKSELAEALKYNDHEAAKDAINACCRPKPPSCAMTEAQVEAPPTVPEALTQPLLPTEIPFILPVTLQMEMGQPVIGPTHVERLRTQPEALKERCCQSRCCTTRCDDCTTTSEGCTDSYAPFRGNSNSLSEPAPLPPLTSTMFNNVFK